jgi:hypothetical protein
MAEAVFRSVLEFEAKYFPNPTLEKLVEYIELFNNRLKCNLHTSEDSPNEGHLKIEKKSFFSIDLIRTIIMPFYFARGFKLIGHNDEFTYMKKDNEIYRINLSESFSSYSISINRDHIMELNRN